MYYVDLLHILHQLCLFRLHHWWWTRGWKDLCFPFHRGWRVGWHSSLKYLSSLLQDGTPGLKGQQWTKVDAREETWHIFAVPEGLFLLASTTTLSLWMAFVLSCFRVDTLKRWCATEVDSDGAMVPVRFLNIKQLSLKVKCWFSLKGKWGWCKSACYEEQLTNGFDYCGNHSTCVNNDDDTRGLKCDCDAGYTAHKGFFGRFLFLEMLPCFVQAAVTLTSARRVGRSAARTQIASTLMAATIVSVKWDLGEIHVRFY